MQIRVTSGLAILAIALGLAAGPAWGATFSFAGTFNTDDQLEVFSLNVASPSTVTMRTWSYAGGTNGVGTVIPSGGLDPFLSLFDSVGTLINLNDDGTGIVATDPSTGNGFDSLLSLSLGPGTYTLVLTESDNQPFGPTFADGFSEQGLGNFTSIFACSNGVFCDISTANRNGNWALDIDNVSSVTDTTSAVPEPRTIFWLATGMTCIFILQRRRRIRIQ